MKTRELKVQLGDMRVEGHLPRQRHFFFSSVKHSSGTTVNHGGRNELKVISKPLTPILTIITITPANIIGSYFLRYQTKVFYV